jgi:ribosomal protein L24E
MIFKKKCEFCKKTIEKGEGIKEEVEVYGRVGTWERNFCSEECLEKYKQVTAELMKSRRPNVCMRCLR